MHEYRGGNDQPEPPPRRASHHIGAHVIRQPEVFQSRGENKVARVEPQLLAERDDDTLLHFVDILLAVLAWVEPGKLCAAEKQELGSEAEVDGAASDLRTLKQRRDNEATLEVGLVDGTLKVLPAERGHGAGSHADATVLISIALPTSS